MSKNELHGPGSKLMDGGVMQYEGNFINGKLTGKGYCISFDNTGSIKQVMVCEDGHPVSELVMPEE